jgi:hypothetical protein
MHPVPCRAPGFVRGALAADSNPSPARGDYNGVIREFFRVPEPAAPALLRVAAAALLGARRNGIA